MAKKSNKKNWIKGAIKRPGALTRKADKAGKSVAEFRDDVLANPNKYSPLTRKQANFAKTLASFQGGGNPYSLPTSSSTSGYTSTMSGMAGAQQAQMQLAQLQQEAMAEQMRQNQAAADRNLAEKQALAQQAQATGAEVAPDLLRGIQAAKDVTGITKGVASAQQVARASKDTADLLSNLNAYGQGAEVAGQGLKAGLQSMGPGPIAAAASIGGKLIEKASDDNNDTKTTFGEGFGRGLSGAGTGVGLAAMAGLGPLGLGIAGAAGLTTALINQRRQKLAAREEEQKQAAEDAQLAATQQRMFETSTQRTGQDLGYNIGSSMTNSYLPGYQQGVAYKAGGEMIKRADGSYSQRGLWDNIRANKGSGKAPTKQMLEQEKKIKAEEKKKGGYINPLPGGAVEFVGPKHAQGGIMLDKNTEVEGGETMDKVTMKDGGAQDYIFSDYLKLGGKTFAKRHKDLLNKGASQTEIQNLAKMQEQVAKKEGRDENGPRDPNMIMQLGGMAETGVIPTLEKLDQYQLSPEEAYSIAFPEGQSRTEEGLYRRADGAEVTMDEVEKLKANNPWYDWEGFDPTDTEDVKAFQEAYNEQVPEDKKIRVDGKVGEQTVSVYIPYRRLEDAPTLPPSQLTEDADQNLVTEEDTVEDTTAKQTATKSDVQPIRLRKDPLLPWQLMGPFAELSTKYPQPDKIAAQPTGRIKLPRVNFNAERAALAGSTNAANKYIESQAAGPGAIAAKMATNERQRMGNLDIANAEARANKELAAQEELANLQASQFDSTQGMRASMFNKQAQNARNQAEYEKRMLAFNQLGTNLAQYGKDLRAYKAEERLAEASQINNEYTRQKYLEQMRADAQRKRSPYYGMDDNMLREQAAQMVQGTPTWNMQNEGRVNYLTSIAKENPESKKKGGYVRKLGGVKRKK